MIERTNDQLNYEEVRDLLVKLSIKIRKAGLSGKGCRLSKKETFYLQFYDLPSLSQVS